MITDWWIKSPAVTGPEQVVRSFNAAWVPGYLDTAIRLVAEGAVYTLFISEDLLPVGGETVGRDAIEAGLRALRQQFEYLLYRPGNLSVDGNVVRYQVEFMYRHRASGEMLTGRFRIVMRVEDDLIVSAEEYHDRAKIEAFLRLFASS
jgi:ketosteroid isomerase-like protein